MADRSSPARWRLYVITDERLGRGWSHLQIAEAAIRSGAGSRGAIYRSDWGYWTSVTAQNPRDTNQPLGP